MKRQAIMISFCGLGLMVVTLIMTYMIYDSNPYLLAKHYFNKDLDPDQVSLVADHISKHYVDEISQKDLMRHALEGMGDHLDPYSFFVPPQDQAIYNQLTDGEFGGIGVTLQVAFDQMGKALHIYVVSVIPNGPADKAGVLANDVFWEVDGQEVHEMTNIYQLVRLIKGEVGATVNIKFKRANVEELHEAEMVRAIVEVPSVSQAVVLEEVSFTSKTLEFNGKSTKQVLSELTKVSDLKGVIFDLRDNTGGLMREAISISSLFLKKDQVVVLVKSRQEVVEHKCPSTGQWSQLPLYVLVNRNTASASEIFAGAMQDHGRAQLWGETTYGKFSVQDFLPLENGKASFKITIARWLTPNRRHLQSNPSERGGLVPDVKQKANFISNKFYLADLKQAWNTLKIKQNFEEFIKSHPPHRSEPIFRTL